MYVCMQWYIGVYICICICLDMHWVRRYRHHVFPVIYIHICMNMYTCMCIYMYTYIYMCLYVYVCMSSLMYWCIRIYVFENTLSRKIQTSRVFCYIYIYVSICIHLYIFICTYIFTCVCMYVFVDALMYIYICMWICIEQEDTDITCFLLSTRAGGMGINLTSADTVW